MGIFRRLREWWGAVRGGHRVYVSGEWTVSVRCGTPGSDGEPRKIAVRGWGVEFVVCPVCGRFVGLPGERYRWRRESGRHP